MNEVTYFDGKKVPIIFTGNPSSSSEYYRHREDKRTPRHCIRETFSEGLAPGCVQGCWLKVWTFHYSDGTTEQLKQVIEK